jgi:hypothetical protein
MAIYGQFHIQLKKFAPMLDAWGGDNDKWNQITQAISQWKFLKSKVDRFYTTKEDLDKRDFIWSKCL